MCEYHPDNPKLVANWFDPHNEEHLRAWKEAEREGWWPQWFQDKMDEAGIEAHACWSTPIMAKLAKCWVDSQLGSEEDKGKAEVTACSKCGLYPDPTGHYTGGCQCDSPWASVDSILKELYDEVDELPRFVKRRLIAKLVLLGGEIEQIYKKPESKEE